MKLLIFTHSYEKLEYENHIIFANAFLKKGWDVYFSDINSINIQNKNVFSHTAKVKNYLYPDSGFKHLKNQQVDTFDLVWVMNQPHPNLEKDIYQMLWVLSKRVRFVNSLEAIHFANNKNALSQLVPERHVIESYTSNSFEELWSIYSKDQRSRWIVKPANSGCGSDVYILNPGDTNIKAILQSMTGNTSTQSDIYSSSLLGLQNKYAILQKYIDSVGETEKRVVLAGGKIIGQYQKSMAQGEHRANYAQGGGCDVCDLSIEEEKFCSRFAGQLKNIGLHFVGIDLAYPYVIELNIVNPGGMDELAPSPNHVCENTNIAVDALLEAVCFQ